MAGVPWVGLLGKRDASWFTSLFSFVITTLTLTWLSENVYALPMTTECNSCNPEVLIEPSPSPSSPIAPPNTSPSQQPTTTSSSPHLPLPVPVMVAIFVVAAIFLIVVIVILFVVAFCRPELRAGTRRKRAAARAHTEGQHREKPLHRRTSSDPPVLPEVSFGDDHKSGDWILNWLRQAIVDSASTLSRSHSRRDSRRWSFRDPNSPSSPRTLRQSFISAMSTTGHSHTSAPPNVTIPQPAYTRTRATSGLRMVTSAQSTSTVPP